MNKKFTLIELLVVVAIIGILASLLLPVLGNARKEARRAVCVSNLKQQGNAAYLYVDDNDQTFFWHAKSGAGYWRKEIHLYMNETGQYGPQWWAYNNPAQTCPIAEEGTAGGYGYSNFYLGAWPQWIGANNSRYYLTKPAPITQITKPSETFVIGDSTDEHIGTGSAWLAYWGLPPSYGDNVLGNRHKEGANILWADGSVSHKRKVTLLAGQNGNIDYYWARVK